MDESKQSTDKSSTVSTAIIINGGAGRVICAIPALEKYIRNNPDKKTHVVIHGWDSLCWGNPLLQPITFNISHKGIFDQIFKNSKVICPEPYYVRGYYNQQLSMAEAFDQEINDTQDHSDLTKPNLYISKMESNTIKDIIRRHKTEKNKSFSVVIQPYGSGMVMHNTKPFDTSNRSMDVDDYLKLIKTISKDCVIYYFGLPEFRHPLDDISIDLSEFRPDLRMYMSLISECDYFIGCDSVGQHMARAFDKPGLVLMGSTFEKNVSYPDHFTIFRKKDQKPWYNPIRFGGVDSDLTDRLNDGIMDFSNTEIEQIASTVVAELSS